jgi:hypothetical protein
VFENYIDIIETNRFNCKESEIAINWINSIHANMNSFLKVMTIFNKQKWFSTWLNYCQKKDGKFNINIWNIWISW